MRLVDTAKQQQHPVSRRRLAEMTHDGPIERLGRLQLALVTAQVEEYLREGEQVGPVACGLLHHRIGDGEISF